MARRYADELGEIARTYRAIRDAEDAELGDIVAIQREFDRRNAYFVGSGGAIAVAQLAANVHTLRSPHASQAMTPLSLAMGRSARVTNATVGLFTARARHPDVRLAARAIRAQPANRVVLLTQLDAMDVSAELAAVVDEIVVLPTTQKDGFLATNSIVAMAGAWVKAAGFDLPDRLPMLESEELQWPEEATRALIVYGPDQLPAALDLEARLSETGLLDVQLADLRNVAHGRHVGLLRRASSTAVITLGDPGSQALLEKTIALLPTFVRIVDLSTSIAGPAGTLDALVGSMRLVGSVGTARDFDPGQPHVSPIGRKLYHLPWSRLAGGPDGLRPARLKAAAAGMSDANAADLTAWSAARKAWSSRVNGRHVRAIVMDYDGTCVPTSRRTSPPPKEVQTEIVRLLGYGLPIAIASGRGPSVIDELQRWVPQKHWGAVLVGLYNGAVINPLSQPVRHGTQATEELRAAADLLETELVGDQWSVSPRLWQVTVERHGTATADAAAVVRAVLGHRFGQQLKVVESGHSVDIVRTATTKRAVADRLDMDVNEMLLVGDQGDVGGNDFELLSYADLSLSVDRVSADGSHCWNLSEDGTSGPSLLAQYLQAVQPRGTGARFVWPPRSPGRAK